MRDVLNDALRQLPAVHSAAGVRAAREEAVVVEAPVALLYNGEPFAVMMATPADLADFALGFALSEGIVAAPREFSLVDIVRRDEGHALHAAIPQARFEALAQRRRALEGRSGCGLCGVESLRDALRPVPRVAAGPPVRIAQVNAALAGLARQQPLNARSGGVHAAGFAHAGGLLVREDVGRHNALDKLIGAGAATLDLSAGFVVITSRASYEIVHKAATVGVGLVVAISAPTDLAIRVADDAGLTLCAFARGDAFNVYTHPARLQD